MTNYYIKATDPDKWVRPAGWLTMPTITSSDNKIAILVAVYADKENGVAFQYANSVINATINWGDGTTSTVTSTTIVEKRYDYATLSSIELVDEWGDTYKQAIATITYNSGVLTAVWALGISNTTIGGPGNRIGLNPILEIIVAWTGGISVQIGGRPAPLCKSLIIKKLKITAATSFLSGLPGLRNIEGWNLVDSSTATLGTTLFANVGNINKIDFSLSATQTSSLFNGSFITKLGDVNLPLSTTAATIFQNCYSLTEVGNLNIASATNAQSAFLVCPQLRKIGTITSTAMTIMNTMFQGCYNIRDIAFTSCANVTTATTPFASCISLETLRMPGMAVDFSIAGCNLQRTALVQLFNDLATVIAKTITINGNPGVTDLTAADLLIATAKGWSIVQTS